VVKNKTKLLVVANYILLVLLVTCIIFANFKENRRIVTINSDILFNNFIMTKELKRIGEKEFNSHKAQLDSLYFVIQSQSISEQNKQTLMQQFLLKKEGLVQFNQNFAASESSKIWSRIHSYTEEFSKENNYQLILGSENKTPVLYAAEGVDVTQDLLKYINKRYEGLK
jgi:outer membrane protein